MKVKAVSNFHNCLSVTFINCKEGINRRRLIGKRAKYCLDYPIGCGCGYPISRTTWTCQGEYYVSDVYECEQNGDEYGRGYICFNVLPKDRRRSYYIR